MSIRTLLRLTVLAGLAAPLCAFALGVGPLAVRSALNENFDADIPLIVNNPAELMGLTVRIPQQQEFDRAGIERLATFSKLRVSVQTAPGGPHLVKIRSIEPIRNPNFNLLLELVWPRGRLIREFTVQLDPELYVNRRPPPPPLPSPVVLPPPVAAPAAAPPPRPALNLPPAPQVSLDGASTYGPIRPGETLSGIASRVRPASSSINTPQMMAILLAANPQAFANGDPNTLRKGAVLRVPSAQALGGQNIAEAAPPAVSDLSVPPPAVPDVAAVQPPPAAPVPATPKVDSPPATPPAAPLPPPIPPLPAPTPPSVVETPATPVTPTPLPTGHQPQDIVPQASLPQTPAAVAPGSPVPSTPNATGAPGSPLPSVESTPTTSGSTVTATATPPPTTAPTGAVTPPSGTTASTATPTTEPPKPAALPPPVKPPVQPVVEPEPSWLDNPVIWLGSALILLAIAALILLPLLRRRARLSPAPVSPVPEPVTGRPSAAQTSATPAIDGPTRVVRPLDPAIVAALAASAPAAAVATPEPSSVSNLLRDIDLGVGNLPLATNDTVPQAVDRQTPLLDTEPATASDYQKPSIPAMTLTKPAESIKPAPVRSELPTELQFDGMDFDFGDMKLQQTGSQPVELAPLEMKPTGAGAKAGSLPAVPIDRMEPATEPASGSGAAMAAILAADETVAMPLKPGAREDQMFDLDLMSMRSQPSELLPLEMKPTPSDQDLLDRLPRGIDRPEPVTEPGTFSGVSAILSAQSAADAELSKTQVNQPPAPAENKFDFSDITQEMGRQTDDISLTKLDEDLRSFGDKTLELAPMDVKSLPVMPENAMADYMETKLDLAMAYLDMGDQMGARSLLETVLQEGDASQKQRANDILKKLT